MDRPTVIRRVRIAVSVFYGVLTMALCVLWVRSYWRIDCVKYVDVRRSTSIHSVVGRLLIGTGNPSADEIRGWTAGSFDDPGWDGSELSMGTVWGFSTHSYPGGRQAIVPFWFSVPIAIAFAASPWLTYRFSLRTLFIAATLVAIVLGLTVLATR